MKIINTNSNESKIFAEIAVSTDELQILETALSYALRSLGETEIERLFGDDFKLLDMRDEIQEAIQACEKLQPELIPKERLKKFVAKFRKWLADNYSEEKIKENLIDDAGYPHWKEIESYFSEMLANKQLSTLNKEDKINLLYLIARNWDIGSMIGWISPNKTLSHCGELEEKDFIDLAKTVAELNHSEFDDAKCQFASSFKKFAELTPEIEEILLMIYETGDEYSKRLSLISLAKLGYHDIKNLLKKSWTMEESELHKIGCLTVIDEYLKDEDLLREYITEAETDDRRYISEYVTKLKMNKRYENQDKA